MINVHLITKNISRELAVMKLHPSLKADGSQSIRNSNLLLV